MNIVGFIIIFNLIKYVSFIINYIKYGKHGRKYSSNPVYIGSKKKKYVNCKGYFFCL